MLTISQAAQLINLFPIPIDVRSKILTLFIGFGTPSSIAIQPQIASFNASYYDTEQATLWSLRVFLNNTRILSSDNHRNLYTVYELQIAYLTTLGSGLDIEREINRLKIGIMKNNLIHLFRMFYNLDKNVYYYKDLLAPKFFGTPSANVIQNAIYCGVIKIFNPNNYYMNIRNV